MKKIKIKNSYRQETERGFTLVEMLVSLSIFVVVMTVIMGAVLNILDVNRKAQSEKTAVDNISFAVEDMSRIIRFGGNFHCGAGGDVITPAPQNCSSGGTSLTLRGSDGTLLTYALSNGAITRSVNGGTPYAITSPEVNIQSLKFFVFGAPAYGSDYLQPKMIMTVSGIAGSGNKTKTQSAFHLETTVSQRRLDI